MEYIKRNLWMLLSLALIAFASCGDEPETPEEPEEPEDEPEEPVEEPVDEPEEETEDDPLHRRQYLQPLHGLHR